MDQDTQTQNREGHISTSLLLYPGSIGLMVPLPHTLGAGSDTEVLVKVACQIVDHLPHDRPVREQGSERRAKNEGHQISVWNVEPIEALVLLRVSTAVRKHHDQRNLGSKWLNWLILPKHCTPSKVTRNPNRAET